MFPQVYLFFCQKHAYGGCYAGSSSQSAPSRNPRSNYHGFIFYFSKLLEGKALESS